MGTVATRLGTIQAWRLGTVRVRTTVAAVVVTGVAAVAGALGCSSVKQQ